MWVLDNVIVLVLLEELNELLMLMFLILFGVQVVELDLDEICDKLEKQVGLILYGGYLGEQFIIVVDLSEGEVVIVCEGVGDIMFFQ